MRLVRSWKNYLAQVVLQADVPIVTPWIRDWLVDLHTDFFVDHSETDGEARREHFRALFDATMDVDLRALEEGYPESKAREITHIQGSLDLIDHGWGELIEFPPEEAAANYERYRDFYDRHDCSPEDPLGSSHRRAACPKRRRPPSG